MVYDFDKMFAGEKIRTQMEIDSKIRRLRIEKHLHTDLHGLEKLPQIFSTRTGHKQKPTKHKLFFDG